MSELTYHVVRNAEEQYSIWPTHRDLPAGWETVGPPAGKEECLARIEEIWTDIRPKSLREKMAALARNGGGEAYGHG